MASVSDTQRRIKALQSPLEWSLKKYGPFLELIPPEQQLTNTVCALATSAIELYMADTYGTELTRLSGYLKHEPFYPPKNYDYGHVMLFDQDEERLYDPTYCQFYALVGMSRRLDADSWLFPVDKIATWRVEDGAAFADGVAQSALAMRDKIRQIEYEEEPYYYHPDGSLLDADADVIRKAYRGIWDLSQYEVRSTATQLQHDPDSAELLLQLVKGMREA